MQAVVGEAEKKRWEHGWLPKKFVKEVYTRKILSGEELKGFVQFVRRLYFMRRLADYHDTVLSNSVEALVKKSVSAHLQTSPQTKHSKSA